ncbi:MAG: CoA transferase [Chloroflexi bacterium]|nr:CoA transferase [Chloroflexota bacterium]
MPGPLEGIKVVELGVWVAGPSCAAILGDWGAQVTKIEPPDGDPFRGLFAGILGIPENPPFELDNRGKRSICLDLANDQGAAIARRLVDEADVFVSNMRPRVLEKFGLDYEQCAARNPRLIYCQVSGYGVEGEDANRAAYDVGAFWSRGAVAASLMPNNEGEPPQQRGGMGDHMTGANAAGAVSAALYNREKTGKGQRVAVSLLRVGAYMMGWDLNTQLRLGALGPPYDRRHSPNPIINSFRDSEGRWFWLLLLQADRHWPDLVRALDAGYLDDDPRFASIVSRLANAEAVVAALDKLLAKKSLAEWGPIFDRENVWYAPVQTIAELAADPLAETAGVFVEIESPDGPKRQVATPAVFYGTPVAPGRWAPELGQDTEQVLLDMGLDWDAIIALKDAGGIP